MASRTISTIVGITFFLVCNTNAAVPTTGHSVTLVHSENSSASTSVHSTETTLSPALDVTNTTFTNTNTAKPNASEPSQISLSTTTDAATTHSTTNVSESSTIKVISTSTSVSKHSTTAPLTSVNSHIQTSDSTTSASTHDVSTSSTTVIPTAQNNGTETTPNGTDKTATSEDNSMMYSEIILTSIFSTILVIVVLVILLFGLKRCLRGRSQYYHHPLHETSYESADRHAPPDDTLVISGGLYEAPRIYNPNMTVLEEEEPHHDYVSFNSRPGQFRLEFLPGDKETDPEFNEPQRRNV